MSDPRKPHLPIIWQGADGRVRTNAQIEAPSPKDVKAFGGTVVDVCGGCKFFQPKHLGEKKPLIDRFLAKVLIEAEWRDKKFIGQPPETLGRCGMNAELATGPMSQGCDQFRPKNGRIP